MLERQDGQKNNGGKLAGWSEPARSGIEIFKLVDTKGLTPLLMVLNEPAHPADRAYDFLPQSN